MQAIVKSSLWIKLVGAFAVVTLLTLAVSIAAFYAISQGEFARFLAENSTSIDRIIGQTATESLVQPGSANEELAPETIIAITVPMQDAIRDTTTAESAQFLANLRRAALGAVGFAAALTLITGTLLFRQITRPLARLQTAALALGAGEMGIRVPVTTGDEVGQVGQAFNHMADRLEAQEKLRRQMVADVAHELRTPLSVIRSNLEAMLDGLITPEPRELNEVHEEVLRLIRLTEDLRLLSLADAGQLRLEKTQVDVADLIETIIRRMTPAAQAQEIILEGDIQGISTTITGDSDKLKQALINLVDNSLRHTPAGGRVILRARQAKNSLTIAVLDNGPGIPPSDQPYVFERFWRGDHSRSRAAGGSGLGLAIVKQIVHLHGGTITLDTPPTGGSRFTITLPLSA